MSAYSINIILCSHQRHKTAKKETTNFLNYRLAEEEKSPCIFVRYTIEVLLSDGQLCAAVSSAGLTGFYGILCFPEEGKFFLQGPVP